MRDLVAYLGGLLVGPFLLVLPLAVAGAVVQGIVGAPAPTLVIAPLAIGALVAAILGPNVPPSRRWAVPRHWTRGVSGKVVFGLLRGVGVLTYSPHSSFLVWLVLVFLSASGAVALGAIAFAFGLFGQSVAYSAISVRHRGADLGELYRGWGEAILTNSRAASLVDAAVLGTLALAWLAGST